MPGYVHLPRWETLHFETGELITSNTWSHIASLNSQPTPSLKYLPLRRNKIDFHAFPNAPNLEELGVLYSESLLIVKRDNFPNLKKVHITHPEEYPLSAVCLDELSLRTLIIGRDVEVGGGLGRMYPSLSMLEFTVHVLYGIVRMSAPSFRHLIPRNSNLFCIIYPYLLCGPQHAHPMPTNREVIKVLAGRFPTVVSLGEYTRMCEILFLRCFLEKRGFF